MSAAPADLAADAHAHGGPPPADDALAVPHRSVSASASIPLFGSLAWMVWFWVGTAMVVAAIIAVLAVRDAPPDGSVWDAASAMFTWLTFAAGVSLVPSFGPMFVANGATRRHLSAAGIAALAALSALAGVVSFVGFVAEGVAYDALDWPHAREGIGPIDGIGAQLGLGATLAAVCTCFAAAGWIAGVGWRRTPDLRFAGWLVVAAIPVAAGHLVVERGSSDVGGLGLVDSMPLGAAICVAIAAAFALLARRLTLDVPFRS